MNGDGIVAEVIFPGGSLETISPFDVGLMTYQYPQAPEIWYEGCRAYNRWLADFCAETPGQRAGSSPSMTWRLRWPKSVGCGTTR